MRDPFVGTRKEEEGNVGKKITNLQLTEAPPTEFNA